MIVLDTNIVMELLEKRAKYEATRAALTQHKSKDRYAVTSLTVSNVFYLFEKQKSAFPELEKYFDTVNIISVSGQDSRWALEHYAGQDLEDALQVAAAISAGCTAFLTLDAGLAKKYASHLSIELIR